ncbi:hypothetical protein HYH03_010080 [Edaphochlamys debaryana]|uniref:Uncharacterized protein n=1 Tax=Edaphochlamys debaryana TaxID=47281 RepID=A0A836BXR5_9CHLO|nr:hypothetical protein HYH03_010080 [Edaphochlamys debaryana]|eukprot:KAG2491503.1 hypothetical protein HYH03_010080 [Edaphochlamys debaryana]
MDVAPGSLSGLCRDGLWLQRWPLCSKLTLELEDGQQVELLLPFVGAPLALRRHITDLAINSGLGLGVLQGVGLLAVLRSVPQVHHLLLNMAMPGASAEQALTSTALASLTQLTSLLLGAVDLAKCISPGVAAHLTHLDLRDSAEESLDQVATVQAALPALIAMTHIKLSLDERVSATQLRGLLDALPATVQQLRLRYLDFPGDMLIRVRAGLWYGRLAWFELRCAGGGDNPSHAMVSAFLAEALLPSRVLGPRLPRLGLQLRLAADVSHAVPNPDPALPLLARCDTVDLEAVWRNGAISATTALAVVRAYGMPQYLGWTEPCRYMFREHVVRLRAAAAGVGGCGSSGGGGNDSKGGNGGGNGGGGSGPPAQGSKGAGPSSEPGAGGGPAEMADGPLPPPLPLLPPPLPLPALLERAVACLAAASATASAAGSADGGATLLLRGPGLHMLLASPAALEVWVRQLVADATAALPKAAAVQVRYQRRGFFFQPLHSAGALTLECGSDELAAAAATAARRLAGSGGAGGAGGVAAALLLEALPTPLSFDAGLQQVLQALWDGAEEGGPGPATGSREGEVARLRWLLETWEGVRALPRTVDVT